MIWGTGLRRVRDQCCDGIKRRALHRAEQLSNIYLDEAARAAEQSSMDRNSQRNPSSGSRACGS